MVIISNIIFRDSVNIIIKIANKEDSDVLDFSGVKFISRSFADELYTFIERNTGNPETINKSEVIDAMLSAVANTHLHGRHKQAKISVGKATTKEELTKFLSTF